MDQSVLITGAAGRIGRTLTAGLSSAGLRLRLTDRDDLPDVPGGCEFVRADLHDPAVFGPLCRDVTAVVHLAGHPNSRDWDVVQSANVDPTRRLFESAVAAGAQRLVYASSVHVAGYAPADARLTADMELRPDGPYGLSKVAGEMMLRYAVDRSGCTGVALRICSFRPSPTNARELRTWLSPYDMIALALAALTSRAKGFHAVWGISNNGAADVDRSHWQAIGYQPRDDASDHRSALADAGVDVDLVSEWRYLGGAFADADRM